MAPTPVHPKIRITIDVTPSWWTGAAPERLSKLFSTLAKLHPIEEMVVRRDTLNVRAYAPDDCTAGTLKALATKLKSAAEAVT